MARIKSGQSQGCGPESYCVACGIGGEIVHILTLRYRCVLLKMLVGTLPMVIIFGVCDGKPRSGVGPVDKVSESGVFLWVQLPFHGWRESFEYIPDRRLGILYRNTSTLRVPEHLAFLIDKAVGDEFPTVERRRVWKELRGFRQLLCGEEIFGFLNLIGRLGKTWSREYEAGGEGYED